MSGRHINQQQAKLYMKHRTEQGLSQASSAAKVGISERSGRTIEQGRHHSSRAVAQLRHYKTRKSPIDEIWVSDLEPMLLANPRLQAKTLLLHLQRTYLDEKGQAIYGDSVERTLQRRVAKWQALNGSPKPIIFPQTHYPGEQGLSDFSHFKQGAVTIDGKAFKHMLYHFRLVYSKWSFVKVIQSGESMQALSEGLQAALSCLGGSPREHRTDSLSAAFKNMNQAAKDDLTQSYTELCQHYGMEPTRNNKGQSHENGSVESSHGHLKRRLSQELILRGSSDFDSVLSYEQWVQGVVADSNRRNSVNFISEQLTLQPLPKFKAADFEVLSTKVSKLSLMIIKGMRYSVPSQLAGHVLTLHLYQHHIQAYLGSTPVLSFDRQYGKSYKSQFVINYKHMVPALLKKPGAFRNCQYRDELFPSADYKRIWEHLDAHEAKAIAPKIMLRLLNLAAHNDCETELAHHVQQLIADNNAIAIDEIEAQFNLANPTLPQIEAQQHDITAYDAFIEQPRMAQAGEPYASL